MIGWVLFGLWAGGLTWAHLTYCGDTGCAARDWGQIGAMPCVEIVNASPDSLTVRAQAPAVDDQTRAVGVVAPFDVDTLRLPYAGRVRILLERREFSGVCELNVKQPKVYLLPCPVGWA